MTPAARPPPHFRRCSLRSAVGRVASFTSSLGENADLVASALMVVQLPKEHDGTSRALGYTASFRAFNVSSAIPDTYGDKATIIRPSVEKSLHITDVLHWLKTPFGNGVFALLIQSDWRKLAFVVQAFRVQKTLRHLVAESPSLVKVCKGAHTNVQSCGQVSLQLSTLQLGMICSKGKL
ncbi:hypothetical protein AUEXF2481DRAFT_6233 [Aureobasidium subglaciale EXF-2481]|uniref:Uncharacterized protein n=1 Tax=Aureobasidium subglaciale (strain EXF-2481) TaxID=1043005 RepID=A0A074Z5H6_AURSE|nr:uncharacterized protein AUEXF2481DRAFT_6233 [Aureobasidium subglaciale EXF-2481]KEQ94181.1 hypothetical protein AUEXF2481DRAFT_6233 [Aureobasidium subglaciale EXF-2481]